MVTTPSAVHIEISNAAPGALTAIQPDGTSARISKTANVTARASVRRGEAEVAITRRALRLCLATVHCAMLHCG